MRGVRGGTKSWSLPVPWSTAAASVSPSAHLTAPPAVARRNDPVGGCPHGTNRRRASRSDRRRHAKWDLCRGALHALDVEPDRQQVLHVEGVHGQGRRDQVLVLLDLHPVVLLLPGLALGQRLVDI